MCYKSVLQIWANAEVVLLSRISESITDYTFTPCVGSITVAPRYNAVVGVHEMEPRCKRGAL